MKLNRDVFGAWLEDQVLRECERALVVTKNDGWCLEVDAEVLKETGEAGEANEKRISYLIPRPEAPLFGCTAFTLDTTSAHHLRSLVSIYTGIRRNRALDN